jgi:hypothetical protein
LLTHLWLNLVDWLSDTSIKPFQIETIETT